VTPTTFSIEPASTIRTLSVTTGTQCSWTATTIDPWITITNAGSGSGTSAVTFSVTANAGPARAGTLTVAGQIVNVTQNADSRIPQNLRIISK
jgi:Putative binding domain, N-terminal